MAYTTIDNPALFFNTLLWTGDGNSSRDITGLSFQPDWIWFKRRSATGHNRLIDSVRGSDKLIQSDLTNAEGTDATYVTSFNSNGFSIGNNTDINNNGTTVVSWNWKAGTSFSNDASATGVGDIDSSGSINTDAGFSIIGYNGNNTSSAEIAHGLGTTPSMIIQKRRVDSIASWRVWHNKIHATSGETNTLLLNSTAANASDADNISGVSSTTFTVRGAGGATNPNGSACIAYCFVEKKGYSKFGKWTGNGNADGTFVYTGFRPAFVMLKDYTSSSGYNWIIIDSARSPTNGIGKRLQPSTSLAEYTDVSNFCDFTANGFKWTGSQANWNASGVGYIYMAFAEHPFVTEGTKAAGTAR